MADTAVAIRALAAADLDALVEIDAHHTGMRKPDYWQRVLDDFVRHAGDTRVGLAAHADGSIVGFVLGEVRAFEFGSEPCGWIFAIGVAEQFLRTHVASRLLDAACRDFRAAGVETIRTMVRRNHVPMLTFFRTNGFSGGPYVQLERAAAEEP
jgi:ribosomal protein S18 acetylase RimI-like enzyme